MALTNGMVISDKTCPVLEAKNDGRVDNEARRKFESQRSEKHFRMLNYNHLISPVGLAVCFAIAYNVISRYLLVRTVIDSLVWWTPDTWFCLILGLMGHLTALSPIGYSISVCWPIRPFELRNKPKTRSFEYLRFCLVTRGENVETVRNTIDNWPELSKIDSRITFHIIVDKDLPEELQRSIPSFVKVVLVPASFQPPSAKYKARALEYARISLKLTANDWVLHLDEETQLDVYAVNVCLDFIERGDRHFGMGTIFYNSSSHWTSAFLTVGEITRITDDFGWFRLPFKTQKRPFLGYIHGSFILVNGEVENAVTWDTDCLAEDFWFGYRAANRGYTFGWLDAIAREQPPLTIKDVWAQRKRWFSGIWACNVLPARLLYIGSIIFLIGLVHQAYIIFIRDEPLSIPRWVLIWGVISCTEKMWAAITSTVIQDLDYGGISVPIIIWHVVQTFALVPVFRLMETMVIINALLFPSMNFHVITKI